MKTLRRLALLALFATAAAAAAATAGPPAENVPAPTSAKLVTADELADVVPGWFKGATVEGKGDASTFHIPPQAHTLTGGKETVNWSVFFRLHTRADCPTAVRIFFPCKAVPADANSDRLADLLGMSGAIQDSPAYFIITGSGKDRMLTLVAEMPVATLGRDTLDAEIKRLFRAAERTMSLWGTDLSKPPVKVEVTELNGRGKGEGKKDEGPDGEAGLKGTWLDSLAGPGEVFSLVFDGKGAVKVGGFVGGRDPSDLVIREGKCVVKGDDLTVTFEKGEDNFEFSRKGNTLTIFYKKDGKLLMQELKRE